MSNASEIRQLLGLSIEEFAKIMNVSLGKACKWIGYGLEPDINEQIRLNELLQIYNALFSLLGARKELGLTAAELGEALDIPESKILTYESAVDEEGLAPFAYKLELYKLLESARKREKLMKKVNDE